MYTPNYKMAVTWDDLGRAAWKQGMEGQVTTIRHFGIRCMISRFVFCCNVNIDFSKIAIIRNFSLNPVSGKNFTKI